MSFARVTRKRIALLLALLAALLLFALPAFAEDPISFSLSADPDSLTAPGPVTVSVRVVNNGTADMTEPVVLYDPDGNIVTAFGDGGQALIKQGEYVTAQQTYSVTQAQLDEGKLTYMLSYNQVDANGNVTVQSLAKSVEINYTGTHVDLTVNRTIDPEVVRSGRTVTVQYELYNAGNVEIKNIRIRENSSLSGTAQTWASLAPGERTSIKFTATMGNNDLTSEGKITYYAGDDSTQLQTALPAVTITRANPGLVLDDILTADRTAITNNETVTLTLTIKNNGNISYSNISVTDPTYGELFTNLTLSPGETLVKERQFTLSETTTFKYTVTLPDNTGNTNTVTSNEVKVSVYDPSQVMLLNLMAEADRLTIASVPADVRFTLTVTNNSSLKAENIRLLHGTNAIYTIDSLEPGASATISRDFTVSQAGKFRFTASVKDALDNTVTFDSNEIAITYAAPTATPTLVPIVTPPPLVTLTVAPIEVLEPVTVQTNRILRYAALALAALFAVAFVLFVISSIMRIKRHSASKSAYDHMELGGTRDYTEPARYPTAVEEPEEEPIVPPAEEKEMPSDEILKKAAAPVIATEAENGAYRLTREESEAQPEAEAPAAPAEEAPAPEAPVQPRRHRRSERNAEAPSEDE